MPLQQLISYVQQQLNSGYDINSIRINLINYGYNRDEIEQAINYVYAPTQKKQKPTKIILIAGIVLISILIIITILLIAKPSGEEASLNIDTEMQSKNIIRGSYIMFNTEIEKSGAGMVSLNHVLEGPDGKEIDNIEETTFKSKYSQFRIPSDAKPGKYTIITSAELGDIKKVSKIEFSIAQIGEDELPEEEIPEEAKKEERIEEEIKPIVEDDAFSSMTIWERVEAIKDIAKTSPTEAKAHCDNIGVAGHQNQCYYNIAEESEDIAYCQIITDEKIIDRCLKKIAELTNNNQVCALIQTESRRDNCYMSFVRNGDYSLCDKFVNKYYTDSCQALKTMATVSYTIEDVPEEIRAQWPVQ